MGVKGNAKEFGTTVKGNWGVVNEDGGVFLGFSRVRGEEGNG